MIERKTLAAATLALTALMASSHASAALILDRAIFDSSNNLFDVAFTLTGSTAIEANAGFSIDIDKNRDYPGSVANLFGTDYEDVSILSASTAGFSVNAVDTRGGDSASFVYSGPRLTNRQLAFVVNTGSSGFSSTGQTVDFGLNLTFPTGANANFGTSGNTHAKAGYLVAGSVSPVIATVPEPTGLALMGMGLAGFALSSRKRRGAATA